MSIRNFKRVNRSEHGRRADNFHKILEHEEENCFIPSGNAYFLNCVNCFFKKDFSMEYFNFIESCKRTTNDMIRCSIPYFYERSRTDIGIYDPKSR